MRPHRVPREFLNFKVSSIALMCCDVLLAADDFSAFLALSASAYMKPITGAAYNEAHSYSFLWRNVVIAS